MDRLSAFHAATARLSAVPAIVGEASRLGALVTEDERTKEELGRGMFRASVASAAEAIKDRISEAFSGFSFVLATDKGIK